jgi:hypothetical protein
VTHFSALRNITKDFAEYHLGISASQVGSCWVVDDPEVTAFWSYFPLDGHPIGSVPFRQLWFPMSQKRDVSYIAQTRGMSCIR